MSLFEAEPAAIVQSADSLDELAARINAEYDLADHTSRQGVVHYRNVGLALIAAKEKCAHGEWLPWLKDKVKFSVKHAQRYMKLAKCDVTSHLESQWRVILGNEEDDTAHNHLAQGTGEDEWFTPEHILDVAREMLGGFDTDPASSDIAQETVRAKEYFTKDNEGLDQIWRGRVWLNPPYSKKLIPLFIAKLVEEYQLGNTTEAILLTHSYTDTSWFHLAADASSAICFTRGRIAFVDPLGDRASPTQGQAFTYFGPNVGKFREYFSTLGLVVVTGVNHGG